VFNEIVYRLLKICCFILNLPHPLSIILAIITHFVVIDQNYRFLLMQTLLNISRAFKPYNNSILHRCEQKPAMAVKLHMREINNILLY
jgi:hypothetical protein